MQPLDTYKHHYAQKEHLGRLLASTHDKLSVDSFLLIFFCYNIPHLREDEKTDIADIFSYWKRSNANRTELMLKISKIDTENSILFSCSCKAYDSSLQY